MTINTCLIFMNEHKKMPPRWGLVTKVLSVTRISARWAFIESRRMLKPCCFSSANEPATLVFSFSPMGLFYEGIGS